MCNVGEIYWFLNCLSVYTSNHFHRRMFIGDIDIFLLYLDVDEAVLQCSSLLNKEGSEVELMCNVTGNDNVIEYEWYHDDVSIGQSPQNNWLIQDGRRNDSGLYKCKLKTDFYEKTSEAIHITFTCKYMF